MTFTIEKDLLESLLTTATFVEARDAYTGGHAWRAVDSVLRALPRTTIRPHDLRLE